MKSWELTHHFKKSEYDFYDFENTELKKENKMMPELRFPEFKDLGKIVYLQAILIDLIDCEHKTAPYIKESEYKVVRTTNVKNGKLIEIDLLCTTEAVFKEWTKRAIPKVGEILFTREAPAGESTLVPENMKICLGQRMVLLRPNPVKMSGYYLSQYLQSPRANKSIKNYSIGSTVTRINIEDIYKIKTLLLSLPEQTRIATFLTAVDKRITLLQKKKAELEQYKKGVMQKLFSVKPDGRPPLRFKDEDGNNFPDWEEKKLGDLCEKMQSGGTPKSTKKEYYNGNIPFLSINDMTAQGKYLKFTTKTISQEGLKNSSSWLVPENSLIYSMYASVGFVSINKIPIATSQAVMNMILKENVYLEYLYYYLLSFKERINKYIETGTQGNINAQIVKKINIPFPHKAEQQKIANFLSSIDKSIEKLSKQIEDSILFKKGLLQKMFV